MAPVIVLRRIAEAELSEAKAWYDLQVPGLGNAFLEEFQTSAEVIAESPSRWPVYHNAVRRYRMHRFPYAIYYDLRPEKIRILRIVHLSRDPAAIKDLLD